MGNWVLNTHIVGDVSITDDSNYMMTSIHTVDGVEDQNRKSMECILILPNLKGKSPC